jgi:hypothetical protein
MSDFPRDPREQIGLHVNLVAMALDLLRGGKSIGLRQLDEVVSYVRDQPWGTLKMLLHEEPLYIAGAIFHLSTAEIDALPAHKWEEYQLLYRQITGRTRGRRREYLRKIWPILNELVLLENVAGEDCDSQIVEPEDVPPDGTGPPARAVSGRRS